MLATRGVIRDTHEAAINCVAYSTHRRELYSASADNSVKCWDTETGKVVFTLSGQGAAVTTIWVEGDSLFTGSSDGLVRQFVIDEEKMKSATPASRSGTPGSVGRLPHPPRRRLSGTQGRLEKGQPSPGDPFGAFVV